MDNLMEIADQQASEPTTTTTAIAVNLNRFNVFMQQNPIWNFFEISKNDYLMKSDNEKC